MSKDREFLEKNRWTLYRMSKAGCMKIVEWIDPRNGDVYRQTQAVQIQKLRDKTKATETTEARPCPP